MTLTSNARGWRTLAARPWFTAAVIAAIVVLGTIASLLRVPASHLDTVWAEDGAIFLDEALKQGPFSVLFTGYAGYQHLIPRLVAAGVVSTAPLEWYGLSVFVITSILVALCAAAVFWLSRDLVTWMPARLALAAITVLLPLSAQEVLGNLADIHSYCMWLAPWLMLYRPRNWWESAAWGVVALLCAGTEIQLVILLPLALVNWRWEQRRSWPIVAGFLIGAVAQVVTTLSTPRPSTTYWLGIPSLIHGYLYNTVLPMLNPNPAWQAQLLMASGALVPALVALPFIAAGVVVLVWGSWRQRMLVVALVLASGAIYAGGATIDGSPGFAYTFQDTSVYFPGILNSRYGVSSGLMLAATVPVAASVLFVRFGGTSGARAARITARAALVVLVVWFAIACTQSVSSRSSGVTWSGDVKEGIAVCESAPKADPPVMRIAPDRTLGITCDQLLRR